MAESKAPTRLALHTCEELVEKLKWDATRLEDGWRAYDSFNFVITAHHLFVDWIDSCGSPAAKENKAKLPKAALLVFQAIADLANGSKHWQMTRAGSLKNQIVTGVSEPVIGDWYSYFIAGPVVYVDFDRYSLSMVAIVGQVLGWFQWIFEDAADDMAQQLCEQLEYWKTKKFASSDAENLKS